MEIKKIKSDIIGTATTLFKQCGLRSVSIDDVCRELRISKKTFYNYFKQKEELIEQVLHNIHIQKQNKTKSPWVYDSRKNIIDALMDFDKALKTNADEEKKHLVMLFDLKKYYPHIFQKRLRSMREHNVEIMKTFINKGMEEGVFRQDLDIELTSLFISSQFGNFTESLDDKRMSDIQRLFCFYRDVLIRILANEKGMEYYLKNYYNNTNARNE